MVWTSLIKLINLTSELLDYEPGDTCSFASAISRNKDYDLEERHLSGARVDGLFRCSKNRVENGAVEVRNADDGPTGTKVLKDSRKLGKVLKDMFDLIICNCAQPIKKDLRLYDTLMSGLQVDFVSIRCLGDRFYRLTRDKTLSIPITWRQNSIHLMLRLTRPAKGRREFRLCQDSIAPPKSKQCRPY